MSYFSGKFYGALLIGLSVFYAFSAQAMDRSFNERQIAEMRAKLAGSTLPSRMRDVGDTPDKWIVVDDSSTPSTQKKPIIVLIDTSFDIELLSAVNWTEKEDFHCRNMKPGSSSMAHTGPLDTYPNQVTADHGTEVAQVIMGQLPLNSIELWPIKLGASRGEEFSQRIFASFKELLKDEKLTNEAVKGRPIIINLSATYGFENLEYRRPLEDFLKKYPNSVFVCAAGNESRPFLSRDSQLTAMLDLSLKYQGRFLIVGATKQQGDEEVIADYSNYMVNWHKGERFVLFAPGSGVATLNHAGVTRADGTSFAAPAVSACLTRLLLKFPGLSLTDASDAILTGTTQPSRDAFKYGNGILNLEKAQSILKQRGYVPAESREIVPSKAKLSEAVSSSSSSSTIAWLGDLFFRVVNRLRGG